MHNSLLCGKTTTPSTQPLLCARVQGTPCPQRCVSIRKTADGHNPWTCTRAQFGPATSFPRGHARATRVVSANECICRGSSTSASPRPTCFPCCVFGVCILVLFISSSLVSPRRDPYHPQTASTATAPSPPLPSGRLEELCVTARPRLKLLHGAPASVAGTLQSLPRRASKPHQQCRRLQ